MTDDLSVVILAHGRHDHLRRVLRSLADGELRPREVVVVAMADPDIESVAAGTDLDVHVVPLEADPARLPLAHARNLGAHSARSERLVFLDVDCIADPALLATYAAAFDAAADRLEPVVLAGPVTYLPEGWQDRIGAGSPGTSLDVTALRALRDPHEARPDPAPGELLVGDNPNLFWSLSFAMTRTDFEEVGGFDEAYEGYGGEDTDFGRRLGRAGGTLLWVGGADAYHQYHPVSAPPVEHLADILRNVAVFQQRWGEPCMEGWLAEFERMGLAERDAAGAWRAVGALPEPPPPVLHVVPGPERHGITRHALELLACGDAPVLRIGPDDDANQRLLHARAPGGVHVHLNDTLLGADPVATLVAVAKRTPVTLTLHDLPDPREGEPRYTERALTYTRLWALASGVVVASEHEAGLLRAAAAHVGDDVEAFTSVAVVPLPLAAPAGGPVPATLDPVAAVLGFLYPGKGHEQVLRAASAAGLRGVVSLGAVSEGHADLAEDLGRRAGDAGLTWEVTGFLPDDELLRRAREVAVPLAWHAHASASGSIGSWLAAGRRPLVADGGWVRELAARCPGSVTVVPDEAHLPDAVARALAEPAGTFLAPGVELHPTVAEAWVAMRDAIDVAHRRAW